MPTSISTNNIVTTNNYQNQNPSWVDEFLDFSSARRGAHRRSVSDSVTFLETPMLDGKHDGNNNDNEFDKFDDEQFLSMFSDEISGVNNMPPTLSSSNPSSPSDQNFVNDDNEKEKKENDLGEMKKEEDEKQLKYEPDEVESQCKQEISQPQSNNNNVTSSNDRITDPKRVKR